MLTNAELEDALSVYESVFTDESSNSLQMLANMGVQTSTLQIEAFAKQTKVISASASCTVLEQHFAKHNWIDGSEEMSQSDVSAFWRCFSVLGLASTTEKRLSSSIGCWFQRVSDKLSEQNCLDKHILGRSRAPLVGLSSSVPPNLRGVVKSSPLAIAKEAFQKQLSTGGFQIDLKPNPSNAAERADDARARNAHIKKAESQRDREKQQKGEKCKKVKTVEKKNKDNDGPVVNKVAIDAGSCPKRSASDEERIQFCLSALSKLHLNVRTTKHEKAATVDEMLLHLSEESGGKCKNLFLRSKKLSKKVDKDTGLWLISALHDTKVDIKLLSKHLGYKKAIRMANDEILETTLQLNKGELSPLALVNDKDAKVQVIIDSRIMEQSQVWFHPLSNSASSCVSPEDLVKFIVACGRVPQILDFSNI